MLVVAEGERYELEKPINIDCEVELKSFDLALQKFIVGVNEQTVTNRVPTPEYYKNDKNKRDVRYNYQFSKEAHPVETKTGDIVTYKIRIYNEGTRDLSLIHIFVFIHSFNCSIFVFSTFLIIVSRDESEFPFCNTSS